MVIMVVYIPFAGIRHTIHMAHIVGELVVESQASLIKTRWFWYITWQHFWKEVKRKTFILFMFIYFYSWYPYCVYIYIYLYIWVNYNDLTATSLELWLIREMIPKMALFQVSEILQFTQIDIFSPWTISICQALFLLLTFVVPVLRHTAVPWWWQGKPPLGTPTNFPKLWKCHG